MVYSPFELERAAAFEASKVPGVDSTCVKTDHGVATGQLRSPGRLGIVFVCLELIACTGILACGASKPDRIAVIPQTEGTAFWEAEHVGAEEAAHRHGAFVYWNAPTREDDVEAQIALVDRVVHEDYQGLVLAPDQALALITPVRHALAHGIPTVVVGSPLSIPPSNNLFYILNDDEQGGGIAAHRVEELLHGSGTVALLGINPDLTGIMIRARVFEQTLAQEAPGIRIVERRMGTSNVPHEHQVAHDTITSHRGLDVIVALMWTTVDGTLSALDSLPGERKIKVIGFDVGSAPAFSRSTSLDCVIQENTRSIGEKAVDLILTRLAGRAVPNQIKVEPVVITRASADSPEVRRMWSQDWTLGQTPWSPTQ
ncbi:MAG TPA: substrate-binding domain-containing protein [Acidobacteriaceae bacterium]|jgi:ribose transport system substrate-binding protein|nr:substrate-binding domain-containing protein [Acidobacteriaceae bacterium]